MNTLRYWAGVLMLLPVLYNVSHAEEKLEYYCPNEPPKVTPEDAAVIWLDGTVCFKGGKATTDEQQYWFAQAHDMTFTNNYREYWDLVKQGQLVTMSNKHVRVIAKRPHVLPSTAKFVQNLAAEFTNGDFGCGRLTVTSGSRLVSERPPNGSEYSVHPAGMAVDVRVKSLNPRCYRYLRRLLYRAEADRQADITREHWPPHFHVVVIPETTIRVAQFDSASDSSGQGE